MLRMTMSCPKKSLPKKCQFKIYTNTFDFEESISFIKIIRLTTSIKRKLREKYRI